jgi:hypothetical protein
MLDDNNWLGRSQWNDPLFDGLYNEFRIYSHALDQAEVTASFNTGPDFVATPTLVVDRTTGAISVANQTTLPLQLKGYSILSTAGSLNPATWTSIDADNTFDPNGTWTAQSSTSTNLEESVTGGTLDGGSLAAAGIRSIGTPWRSNTPWVITRPVLVSFSLQARPQCAAISTAMVRSMSRIGPFSLRMVIRI